MCALPWPQFLHIIFHLNTFLRKNKSASHLHEREEQVPFRRFLLNKKPNIEPFPKKKKNTLVWYVLGCHRVSQSICGCVGDGRRQLRPSLKNMMIQGGFSGVAKNPVRYSKRFDKTMHILNLFEENGFKKKSMLFGVYAGIIL